MKKSWINIIIGSLILSSFVFADVKIGYIDSNEIMTKFEEVRQVQVSLEKEQRKLQAEMENLIQQLDSLKQEYDRQRLLMSDSRRQEKEQELMRSEQKIQKFQMDKFGPEGEIYRKQNQLLKPVLAKVDEAIQAVGKRQQYDYIMDAVGGAIVYALDSNNLTEDVIEELRKSATTTK
ncbi:MAG: OmpH family outer membrane protein [Candidatus Marinimicrobia bacterium]|nr:OmpH family outer membrane protein [Candidatus Neomarinimicrobiota bacterium]